MVIGISEYNDPKLASLDFCKRGGKDMQDLLQTELHYEFPHDSLIETVTTRDLQNKVYDFFNKDVNPSDTLLFYFTGHGITDKNSRGYFCTSDIDVKNPDRNGLRFRYLTEQMDVCESHRIVAIIDCCHSGAVMQSVAGRVMSSDVDPETAAVEQGRASLMKDFSQGQGRCILASSLSNENSYGMDNSPYSAFTHFIIDGLKKNKKTVDEEGHITPEKLSMFVSEQLRIAQGENYQRPVRHFSITDKLSIGRYDIVSSSSSSRQGREEDDSTRLKNLLIQGKVSEFNELRELNNGVVVFESFVGTPNTNLSGINLQNSVLIDAVLTDVNLQGANLIDARLDGAILKNTNLENANLCGAKLIGSECTYANFDGAGLENINLVDANLENASFQGAHVQNSNLTNANLRNAVLTGANFDGALLRHARLEHANLQRANFEKATCDRANFSYADMTDAQMGGTNTFKAIFNGTIGKPDYL